MQTYRVLRGHIGDKAYQPGDERIADPNDVQHLVSRVLEPVEQKVVAPPENKAAGGARSRKAAVGKAAE